MNSFKTLILSSLCAAALVGCQRGADPVEISGYTTVKDADRGFSIKLPSNWSIQKSKGERVLASTTKEISRRFENFGPGEGGAKIDLMAVDLSAERNLDTLIKNFKIKLENQPDRYKTESATVDGKKAKKIWIEFDQEDGQFRQEAYFVEQDSVVTVVQFAAFGRTFDSYKDEFAEILSSVKLAKRIVHTPAPVVDTVKKGVVPPSETMRTYAAPAFTISIPDNFTGEKGSATGISSMNFVGSRLDCSIQVDLFDAKKKSLEDIVEENKDRYSGATGQPSKLSGVKAVYFSYNPTASVSSRAYFAVKDNKMIRVTMNWYKPEQAVYLPIFEKSLASVNLK